MLLLNSEYGQLRFRGKRFDPAIIGLKQVGTRYLGMQMVSSLVVFSNTFSLVKFSEVFFR